MPTGSLGAHSGLLLKKLLVWPMIPQNTLYVTDVVMMILAYKNAKIIFNVKVFYKLT